MTGELSAEWIISAIFLVLLLGIAVLFAGGRLARPGQWLIAAGLFGTLTLLGFNWSSHSAWQFAPQIFQRGWIWPTGEEGSLRIGLYEDPLGFSMTILAAVASVIVLINPPMYQQRQRSDRIFAAMAIGFSGVSLAWTSLTAWLCLIGLSLAIFAGFLSFGSDWDSDQEAMNATKFARERGSSLLLALLGSFILVASGAELDWARSSEWSSRPQIIIGTSFLLSGLFLQLQAFPLLGWLVSPSSALPPPRLLLCQVFPALSVFALLVRIEPNLRQVGIFPWFGWIALASAFLTSWVGLFQSDWKRALSIWTAVGWAISFAALSFAGVWAGVGILVGISLASTTLSLLGFAMDREAEPSPALRGRGAFAKTGIFIAAAGGTGLIGFVSSGAIVQWIGATLVTPGALGALGVALFVFILLAWKIAWGFIRGPRSVDLPWFSILPSLVLILLSLGFVWSGNLSGGVLPRDADSIGPAALSELIGQRLELDQEQLIQVAGAFYGIWLISLLTGYWTSGRARDSWKSLTERLPRFSAFVAGGFGVERVLSSLTRGLSSAGEMIQVLIDHKTWNALIPSGATRSLRWVSFRMSRVDRALSEGFTEATRRSVEAPAKLLQLIQSGNVQWYMLFAVGTGIAILLNFLKLRG